MTPPFPSTRRALLVASAALVSGAAAPGASTSPRAVVPPPPGLHHRATRGNRFFGTAIDPGLLAHDPAYMARVPQECGIVVSESALKWGALRPRPDAYSFAGADALADYAARHALALRGHTLLWHKDNPAWLDETLTPASGERLLVEHVRAVVGHFRGRVVHWDVANEAVWPPDGRPGGLRDSPWHRALGPAALDLAFHACAEADPAPLRFLNEDQIEYAWEPHARKRDAVLELLAGLLARGVPVQALGMQAHLEAGVSELDQVALARFCGDVASLGLRIAVTELDVRDNRLPATPAVRDADVAAHARAYLDAVLPCPAVLGVLTWGLSDRRTWLNDEIPRADGLPQRALPLDARLRRKPLWHAIAAAFEAAPPRPA